MDTFGKRLKHLIKTSEIKTNKRFSEKAHITEQGLSKITTGKTTNPSIDVVLACFEVFSDSEVIWLLTGRDYKSQLELENRHLKEQVVFYEEKLGTIAKPFSNRVNPQKSFPGFERHFANELMRKTV